MKRIIYTFILSMILIVQGCTSISQVKSTKNELSQELIEKINEDIERTVKENNEITKFLGIPVDGTKEEMITKLMKKGFKKINGSLIGEFNGREVEVLIDTNKNKVYRIVVVNKIPFSESQIKGQYNILLNQFSKNKKYISLGSEPISERENISYEMIVNNKTYPAFFIQKISQEQVFRIIENTKNIQGIEEKDTERILEMILEIMENNNVWFMIHKYGNEYYIALYYDNMYNKSTGEDL
ncbi:hypothetical protein [Fusobacterium sp.]|uniref:hypothetical protein n=1 Tax=Fusobacterium sp. TaxID=68766 RepID=UPI0025C005EE|nr:hypothetical protein [Fusobacterium sp.]